MPQADGQCVTETCAMDKSACVRHCLGVISKAGWLLG